jgi:hypothetical protein
VLKLNQRRAALAIGAGTLALLVTACGSSSGGSGGTGGDTPQGQPSFGGNFQAIQQCLDAAGIKLPSRPSGAPSGFPSGAPSGFPSGAPSGVPSGFPSLSPGQTPPGGFGSGQGAGLFNSPKVQRALMACGIQLPSSP